MPSLVVMWSQPSVVKEINLHDRSGTCVVADVRGPEKGRGITLFHAFTGCDVVSAFRGKGNKSAWTTWDMCPEATDVFALDSASKLQL